MSVIRRVKRFVVICVVALALGVICLFGASAKLLNSDKDRAGWLLDTSTLLTTAIIGVIGVYLTLEQALHNEEVRWVPNCERAHAVAVATTCSDWPCGASQHPSTAHTTVYSVTMQGDYHALPQV